MKRSIFTFCVVITLYSIGFSNEKNLDEVYIQGPGCYKISGNVSLPIKIPFTMHNGKPLLQLKINETNASLMIDNGILWDQVWLFGSPLINKLKLSPLKQDTIVGAGEEDPTKAYTSTNLILDFGDIIFYEQPVLVSPSSAGFADMFPGADGQLCNTFFKHFIVEFNFDTNMIILHHPDSFNYNGTGSTLKMTETRTGTHSIPFSFTLPDGQTYSDQVDLDFGGIYTLKIALNNIHSIPLPKEVSETFSYGAQGKQTEYKGQINSFSIGKYKFKNPVVYFGDEQTSRIHPGNLGVIGLPLFMKFNIIFDYINYYLYLEPNSSFNEN